MKGVQCYEFFGGIALKNHEFNITLQSIVFHRKLAKYVSNLSHFVNGSSYINYICNQITPDVTCGLFFILTMFNAYARS